MYDLYYCCQSMLSFYFEHSPPSGFSNGKETSGGFMRLLLIDGFVTS